MSRSGILNQVDQAGWIDTPDDPCVTLRLRARQDQASRFIAAAAEWAVREDTVCGLALVGSYAHGRPSMASDVDLIVLTRTPERYTAQTDWVSSLAEHARLIRTARWGPVTERRLRLRSGLHIDIGFTTPTWAAVPLDTGARRGCTATFTNSYIVLGLLGNTRTFEGAIVSPVAGAWSDAVWLGWLGRRRPFILVGGLLSALLLALTPTLGRVPLPLALDWLPGDVGRLATTILTILLFTVTFNAMDDIHRALLVDIATPEERNGLSALAVSVEMVSQVAILIVGYLFWFDQVPDVAFAVTAALMAVAILVTVLGVRDRRRPCGPPTGRAGSLYPLPRIGRPYAQPPLPQAGEGESSDSCAPVPAGADARAGHVLLLVGGQRGAAAPVGVRARHSGRQRWGGAVAAGTDAPEHDADGNSRLGRSATASASGG